MESQYRKRIRIEIATSVKGVKTFSCTVEMTDTDQDMVLLESDKLVAALQSRYPVKVE